MEKTELIKRAKLGDEQAFVELMRLHRQDMYRTALSVLMNDEDASDAVQDTILACWEKLYSLRHEKYFKTWLIRILLNKSYDIRRKRILGLPEDMVPESGREDVYNLELKEALRQLDEKYRVIIILYYGEDLTTEEIAKILHMNKSTVQTRLKRGREKLKDYFSDDIKEAYNA